VVNDHVFYSTSCNPHELPPGERTVTLADLIEKRARQTAQDWARLNALAVGETVGLRPAMWRRRHAPFTCMA
jgi:hypothetical protein